jgi:hypothetical protein|tara:strand:- start:70 stop:195 length:126 start_codon:yes stop_codon:yes gene_type:complete
MSEDKWTEDQDFQMGKVKIGGDAVKVEDDGKQKSDGKDSES